MRELSALDEGALVVRASRGEKNAYGQLVTRYRWAAFAVALSVAGRREDAEDAAQESFIVALNRLNECQEAEKFGSWLLAIARNHARDLVWKEMFRGGGSICLSA